MRNQAMRHAFEALPQSVLGTKMGRMVFRVLERNVINKGMNHKRGGKKSD